MTEQAEVRQVRSFSVRSFSAEQEPAIVALQQIVRGHGSLEYWRWMNDANPYYRHLAMIAEATKNGGLIGIYAGAGLQMSLAGMPVLATQPPDVLVHPDFRRHGVFRELYAGFLNLAKNAGVEIVFGFPNVSLLGAYLRFTGFPVGYVHCFSRRLRFQTRSLPGWMNVTITKIWQSIITVASMWRYYWLLTTLRWKLTIQEETTLPVGYDNLWKEYSTSRILSVWKDATYLDWRYGRHPSQKSSYFCAREQGKLIAFSVLTQLGKRALISEFVFGPKLNPAVGQAMSLRMQQRALEHGCDEIIFYGKDNGLFEKLCDNLTRHPSHDVLLYAWVISENEALRAAAKCAESWCVTTGDLDAFYGS